MFLLRVKGTVQRGLVDSLKTWFDGSVPGAEPLGLNNFSGTSHFLLTVTCIMRLMAKSTPITLLPELFWRIIPDYHLT
jgi:hypothetical protein